MFEAHYLSSEDYEKLGSTAPCWDKTYFRTHQETQRPLKIWFANGERKNQQQQAQKKSFIYVEYKNARGADRYRCIEVLLAGQSLGELLDDAIEIELYE